MLGIPSPGYFLAVVRIEEISDQAAIAPPGKSLAIILNVAVDHKIDWP
jgi:hypothetical protein